jgi:cytochrome c oxidase subunit 2
MKDRLLTAALVALALVAGSCGGQSDPVPTVELSPAGEAGLAATRAAGCAACHGLNGEGVDGLGPPLIGLSGSQVALEGGTTVTADRAYLSRSITVPDAEVVAGYGLPMPPYQLDPEDLEAILDYLEEIG